MPYRAFVAATKQDLDKQREHVTDRLRLAGLVVDPMENWPADAEHPAKLSAKRTAGCHFCIALVAYQRGTIASHDPNARSITQLEIREAARKGARVLVFLLRDSAENRTKWPKPFNHLDDETVVQWRAELQNQMTCEFFDADTMPDPLPAVTRQIIDWESRRRRKLTSIIGSVVGLLLVFLVILNFSAGLRQWTLSRFLAWKDPTVFQHSRDGQYQVARLLEGRSDLQNNTSFRDEISEAKDSFCLYANTFAIFRDYANDFADLAGRGVHCRFLLVDYSEENRANWTSFAQATSPASLDEAVAQAHNIHQLIRDAQRKYPGKIDLRFSSQPILYTLWLRDPDSESGLGHLGVHFYSEKTNWPCLRVSRRTGGNQLKALEEQFELLWKAARPDPGHD